MGLTVHFDVETTCKSRSKAVEYLGRIRQMAMDLAFESVSEVVEYDKPTNETVAKDDRWAFIQAGTSVDIPWTRPSGKSQVGCASCCVDPEWFTSFCAWPGPGCEPLNITLAQYPRTIEVQYRPSDDARFRSLVENGGNIWWDGGVKFDWKKFNRWCKRNNRTDLDVNYGKVNQSGNPFPPLFNPRRLYETRTLKVRGSSKMGVGSFCKTQYASEFGMAHFVRCHLSVCHLLRRIESLPTFKVTINDEGHYETSRYSDDWQEARKEGREPTYVWHDATLDVKTLIAECEDYNHLVAGMVGSFNDMLQASGSELKGESPITQYSDFEHLEAKGRDKEYMQGFINALAEHAKPEVEAKLAERE